MPARDQLNADWKAIRAASGRQGQAWHVKLRPEGVENRRAGIGEPARSLARRRQRKDRIEAGGPVLRGPPRLLGAAARRSEAVEGKLAAECDFFVAQLRAQQRLVPVEFGHVIAQALKRSKHTLPLVRLRAVRRQLGLADSRTRGGEAFGRALEHGPAFRLRVVPVRAAAQAEPRRDLRDRRRRIGDRHHCRAEQRDIADRAGHYPDRIEGLGVDPHAGWRKQPEARLEPDDTAIGGRPDHRAASLRADGERHHEVSNRSRRAARRPAWGEIGIVRIRRRAGMTVGEFGRDRLPQQYAAGGARQSCGAGVARGPAADINRRAVSCRHVRGVEYILNAERHAPKQSVLPCFVGPARLGQRRIRGEVAPRAHHRLAVGNPLEAAPDDSLAGQRATFDQANQAGGGKTMRFDFRHEGTPGRQ